MSIGVDVIEKMIDQTAEEANRLARLSAEAHGGIWLWILIGAAEGVSQRLFILKEAKREIIRAELRVHEGKPPLDAVGTPQPRL